MAKDAKKVLSEEKSSEKLPTTKKARIVIVHPSYKSEARVWKKDLDAWLAKGWTVKE